MTVLPKRVRHRECQTSSTARTCERGTQGCPVRHVLRRPDCECGGCDWVDEPGADDLREYVVIRCGQPWLSWEAAKQEHCSGIEFARHRRNALAREITGGDRTKWMIFRLMRVG